jgi:hypothetical protein
MRTTIAPTKAEFIDDTPAAKRVRQVLGVISEFDRAMTVAKLRQVDVLVSQGQDMVDAIRQIGVSEVTYYRWRLSTGVDFRRLSLSGGEDIE